MKQSKFLDQLPFKFVKFRQNLLAVASKEIIAAHLSANADLSQVVIWCESNAYAHAIRHALLEAAHIENIPSVILPEISTLKDWLCREFPPEQPLISETNKQLVLMEAIRQFPALFKTANSWLITKELVGLFNECALAQIPFSDGADKIHTLLAQSYASPASTLANISRESEVIYQLWQAYIQQLESRNWMDPVQHYCDCLNEPLKADSNLVFYAVGIHRFAALEANFFTNMCAAYPLTIYYSLIPAQQSALEHHPHLLYCGENKAALDQQDQQTAALDIVYNSSVNTYERIKKFKNEFSQNPLIPWVSLFTTNSIEKHVNAICLQTKQWILEQKFPIGIISNDRLLTRRVRAVLEHAGIKADDLGGWALSTTSAATIIEILLDAIETNFHKEHLFDLLGNPFLAGRDTQKAYLDAVDRLRHRIHSNPGIPRGGVAPYITFVENYSDDQADQQLLEMLQTIQTKSKSLSKLSYQNEIELNQFIEHLQQLLKRLNITLQMAEDEAGKQILTTLETSLHAVRQNSIQLSWRECRHWLRDLLEHSYFAPTQVDQRVTLCGFDHLDCVQFKSVIMAGVEQNRLHSKASQRTFFNEKVRKELGLQTINESEAIKFIRYRRLLEHHDNVLLCAETECRGERQELSPWVKLLELFSQQAFQQSLSNSMLVHMLNEQYLHSQNYNNLATIPSVRPSPTTPADLIPTMISATQYQSLIDCPYQYFAKYILAIAVTEAEDEFGASEFGRLVHQCLHEFHFDSYNNTRIREIKFNADERASLITELRQKSTEVFMRTRYPDAVKQGWLQRWLSNIPAYIEWGIEHSRSWHPQQGEVVLEKGLSKGITLRGQLDRLDASDDGLALTDFKTGVIPTRKSVVQGEVVQLPFYALLSDNIIQAEYLDLGNPEVVETKVTLQTEDLEELSNNHRERLVRIIRDLSQNTPLPALGSGQVCRMCDYQGICRKSHWNTANSNSDTNARHREINTK